jgi:putative tryptophan/tyrosine transport system substrate-binding protein
LTISHSPRGGKVLVSATAQGMFSAGSMRRREFITLIGAAVAAWSLAACVEPAGAQSVTPKRLGVLSGFGCRSGIISQRLAELGWIDGRTLTIDCVSTVDTDQLTVLANELVARRPDVLAASPTAYVRALKQATATIPIVMISTPSPVEMGLVTNLPRPEANVTGTAQSGADNTSKRLQLLKQILPRLARLAILLRAGGDPLFNELATKDANAAASTLGFDWQAFSPDVPEDYDKIFARLAEEGFDAAYVPPGPLSYANITRIVELERRHRVPTLGDHPIFAKNGFLLTYGDDPNRNLVRSAEYVDKILRGSKPGDLPVEQPTTFELVINLKTAKELGLTVPPALLALATEVIE